MQIQVYKFHWMPLCSLLSMLAELLGFIVKNSHRYSFFDVSKMNVLLAGSSEERGDMC